MTSCVLAPLNVPLEVSAVDGEDDVGGLDDGSHGAALGDAELVYGLDRDRCDEPGALRPRRTAPALGWTVARGR